MKIKSVADYYSALERLLFIEGAIDRNDEVEVPDSLMDEYEELQIAIPEYLRGIAPMRSASVGGRAPSPELREEHVRQKRYADDQEYRYLRDLAYRYGITSGYAYGSRNEPPDIERLRMQVVTCLLQNKVLHEKYIQNRKQRIKAQGRVVQCQMCALGFHSVDTERIKPYGSTRYERFCKSCAAKVKEAKAIYQGMVRKRRN